MPNLKNIIYELTNNKKTNHYIETGTYMGHGIKSILGNYDKIHSIELSKKWYNYNVEQFKNNLNVKIYHGDSKKILPNILKNINEPVTIFLDAHYSGGTTVNGEEETPLLFELEILRNREFDDIIIVDDCRLLGKTGICGCGPNDLVYPTMVYDWRNITEEKIIDKKKNGYILLKNENNEITDGPNDQFVLIKKK